MALENTADACMFLRISLKIVFFCILSSFFYIVIFYFSCGATIFIQCKTIYLVVLSTCCAGFSPFFLFPISCG